MGAFPPLHPNALGLCCGCGLVALIILWSEARLSAKKALFGVAVMSSVLVWTQSRTSLIALGISLLVVLMTSRVKRIVLMGWGMIIACLLVVFVEVNLRWGLISAVLTRGGNAQFDGTFTGRTTAWDAVSKAHTDFGSILLGSGLSSKSVGVLSEWASEQTVDGSWASAYLQAGLVGVALISVSVWFAVLAALGADKALLCMLGFLIIESIFESQLNDVSFGLAVFVAVLSLIPGWRNEKGSVKEVRVLSRRE